MEHFHYRNKCQIGHFFMNFHYERYENVKKSVPPKFKNEASDHLKKVNTLKKERYSNFCTFEIASLPNVPRHYLRKYGIIIWE